MKRITTTLLAIAMLPVVFAAAHPRKNDASAEAAIRIGTDESAARLEGEKRFRANCGRCHQAPHKFPARMMVTIERHMRVRALVTDQDMRMILHFMTQ